LNRDFISKTRPIGIALLQLSGSAESSKTDPFDRPIQLQINKKLINSISAQFLFLEKLKTEEKY
jgi:hypothetical protein